jgi:serine protease Do
MRAFRDGLRSGKVRTFILGALFATALWATFFACKGGVQTAPPANAAASPGPGGRAGGGGGGGGIPADGFAPMLARVEPAVVNISATKVERVHSPYHDDPFFRFFFGDRGMPQERRERSLGSGVIARADGVILTNHHVIKDASDITVTLSDKRDLKARILGSDPKTDIAVLRVEAKDLPTLPFGDSRQVRVGDLAFAVGSPFGLAQTATFGIVSAIGRGDLHIVEYEDFIQTDAAINPGNSGGALVNARGELIGINTAIVSRGAQGNQGVGFAVPAHMAKAIMDTILTHGRVVRGWLGVHLQKITPALAKAFRLPGTAGAIIGHVEPGSPAAKAGLRPGDVVTAIDGQSTESARRLLLRITGLMPGNKVKLAVLREGRTLEVETTLSEFPDPDARRAAAAAGGGGALQGLEIQTLTPRVARQLNLPPFARAVVVAGIQPESRAAQAGLRRGDVIFEVNRQRVRTAEELERLVTAASGQSLLLLVSRGDMNLYLVIEP